MADDTDGNATQDEGGALTDEQLNTLFDLIAETGTNTQEFCTYFKIERVEDLPASRYAKAMQMLNKKKWGT